MTRDLLVPLPDLLKANQAAADQAHWTGNRTAGIALDAVVADIKRRIENGEEFEPKF